VATLQFYSAREVDALSPMKCVARVAPTPGATMGQVAAVTIAAKYEDGVFKPLENVEIREGTIVEVRLPSSHHLGAGRRSVREFAFAGMWKDRADMADSLEYVNRLRGDLRG